MERFRCEGLDRVWEMVEGRTGNVFLLFCGGISPETGQSWCPDCVRAEPVIEKVVKEQKNGIFIHCIVGDKPVWKNPDNPFRRHPKLLLKGVPTLLKWNSAKRLVEEECANEDLVRMVFDDNDD